MKLNVFAKSVIGSREINQDAYLLAPERGLFAVADGVGGGLKGEVASKLAVDALAAEVKGPETLIAAVKVGQAAVLKEAMDTIGEPLMGTTLTSIVISGNRVHLAHVGDSRLYLYAPPAIRQMTEDHEIFDETVQASVLSSYLGMPPDVRELEIQEEDFTVNVGESLLLCSDGLYRQLNENQIAARIAQYSQLPETLIDSLCTEAASHEYSDNVTIIYIECR